jgi:hypothetical protein
MTNLSDAATDPAAAERRAKLLGVKLRALVAANVGSDIATDVASFTNGAAIVVDRNAWVLIDGDASRSFGGALSWAIRQSATSLNVIADSGVELVARRSERFTFPTRVWRSQDHELLPVTVGQFSSLPSPSSEHLDLMGVIEAAGAFANVEHGVVFGEVRGLEVCRVVDQPTVGLFVELGDMSPDLPAALLDANNSTDLGPRRFEGVQLEVGVGANDREAFRLLHGDIPTVEALRGVVEAVESHRSIGAPQHPLNRLGKERFLRWRLEQEPTLIGMSEVRPAEPPVARPNLKDPVPCVARATFDGRSTSVVCSTGIDLDLIPFVADVQAMYGDPVIVATPQRDLVPITHELASLLTSSVDLRPVN